MKRNKEKRQRQRKKEKERKRQRQREKDRDKELDMCKAWVAQLVRYNCNIIDVQLLSYLCYAVIGWQHCIMS
jgi:hypothetical protein